MVFAQKSFPAPGDSGRIIENNRIFLGSCFGTAAFLI